MLDHPTLDHLKALRLDGMAEAFAELQAQDSAADLSHAEWLGLLVDREVASRETKRFEARMRSARLRHVGACPEDVDYRARRGLDKALFQNLLSGKWITDKRNLIITGPCGVGKTWLGCALAQAACRDGVTVVYKRMPRHARPWFGCAAASSPRGTCGARACDRAAWNAARCRRCAHARRRAARHGRLRPSRQ